MIVGVGIDVVEIARLASGLARTQRLAIRLFTERERDLPLRSLAARFVGTCRSAATAAWLPLLSSPKAGQTRQRA
jgi:holo-[acyl-carrier protein] synthase